MTHHLAPTADSAPLWMASASCADPAAVDVAHRNGFESVAAMFFPPQSPAGVAGRPAKSVCAGCPVRIECLEHALNAPEHHGIWGGMSERERSRERGRRRRANGQSTRGGSRPRLIEHGTDGGYHAHRRRGEPPCVRCSEAHNAASAERKQQRQASL